MPFPAPKISLMFPQVKRSVPVSPLRAATMPPETGDLIKSKFGVGDWFEDVVELFPPMNTPSLESMAEVMTGIKQCCDLAHTRSKTIKNPARGGLVLVNEFC
jgi:hypothetical protein